LFAKHVNAILSATDFCCFVVVASVERLNLMHFVLKLKSLGVDLFH
jgi:hypothetical protein